MLSARFALGGVEVPEERQREILEVAGFRVANATTCAYRRGVVTSSAPPTSSRKSLGSPATTRSFHASRRACRRAKPTATRSQLIERNVRRALRRGPRRSRDVELHFRGAEAEAFGGGRWKLANPISEEMKVMRPSLLPGLIAAARRNLDRGAVRPLFEIGRRYPGGGRAANCDLAPGRREAPSQLAAGKAKSFDAFDAKSEALALLEGAGSPVANLQLFPDAGPTWHPGRSATLRLGPKTVLAAFGELHPRLEKLVDAPERAVAAEIYLDAIPEPRSSGHARAHYTPPHFSRSRATSPFWSRRMSRQTLWSARSVAPTSRRLLACSCFDRFETTDGLSLAVEVTLQPAEKSFTEAELAKSRSGSFPQRKKLARELRS
jgi:phenylalanyl-tRNA synthetase beta chain